ncbi:prepilin peptidase [Corynebacterium timonense]|uniref:Type 4 prepilin peptidase 1 Aspartic peptidase. MEROPS family A24A n=1 Tax=Corynebacterium timonense TaxID=441500 RepID=A0A1H1NQP8_9CORY|nr:prepilin peptidase [Corynebacterium timonense]SDS00659.1 type 4 prepilin peptidase 1 Aspartic peptidase. MEROPS family A24A [Corynebacterium timonense]
MLIGGSGLFFLFLCACAVLWSTALACVDVTQRRLPDALTLPAGALALAWCVVRPVGLWGLVWPVLYLLPARGIGGGDVKLAVSLGVAVACTAGPVWVLVAVAAASALTLAAAALTRSAAVAHGPAMLAAAWVCALMGGVASNM